jgi:hypothetical protein
MGSGTSDNLFGDLGGGEPKAKLTKEQIARYEAVYKRGWRSLYRWVEKGEKAGDHCPLDDPRAMLHWWPRHNTKCVPPEIEEAALAAALAEKNGVPAPGAPTPPDPSSPPPHIPVPDPATRAASPPPPSPTKTAVKSIRLEDFDPEEGDRLNDLKQLQAAKFDQLRSAFEEGTPTNSLETSYVKLCETIDKIETRVIERMKKRGLYVLRDEVERDLAKNAELLRQMRDSMERRVLEQCPNLTADQRTEVSAAIYKARLREDSTLARLDCLKPDELLRELDGN